MPAIAADFAALCDDRAALERVYHAHRLGTKPPFEQALPRESIERLVRLDLKKEAVLRKNYGFEITPAMVATEVHRIDSTTRAPDVLAEIKAALDHDPERLVLTMARPIVVERELRRRFDQDDALHAARRREAEQARATLLAGKSVEGMHHVTWQMKPRPAEPESKTGGHKPEGSVRTPVADKRPELATSNAHSATSSSGAYTVEATAQLAQVLSAPGSQPSISNPQSSSLHYFEDLDSELQAVLHAQLQKPGDVSAVIETAGGFLVFRVTERTAHTLGAASLLLSKRSYEQWLAERPE